jgi:hypothetical protein
MCSPSRQAPRQNQGSRLSWFRERDGGTPIPVVKRLGDTLEAHKLRMGQLFQAGNGKPLNLDNPERRSIMPALSRCAVCRKQEDEHKPEAHVYQRDNSLPRWNGSHAFRRGLATNPHALGVHDQTSQAILRHSNVGLTMNVCVKSVSESQVTAMDTLSEKLRTSTELAAKPTGSDPVRSATSCAGKTCWSRE